MFLTTNANDLRVTYVSPQTSNCVLHLRFSRLWRLLCFLKVVMMCRLVGRQHFGEIYCFHLQGWSNFSEKLVSTQYSKPEQHGIQIARFYAMLQIKSCINVKLCFMYTMCVLESTVKSLKMLVRESISSFRHPYSNVFLYPGPDYDLLRPLKFKSRHVYLLFWPKGT
jgi:hypothetical protein